MMRRFLAGLLLVAGGALIAIGVSPNWVILGASGQTLNGFTMGSSGIDAVVSFVAGGLLMLIGLIMVLKGGMISRALGFLFSILAMIWAALIVFLLSGFKHDVDHLVPAVSFARDLQIGYFLTAGGALVAFLGGLIGVSVPARSTAISRPVADPAQRAPHPVVPLVGTGVMRPPASLADAADPAAPTTQQPDPWTPTEVGSRRS
jgi:hypothetical protein